VTGWRRTWNGQVVQSLYNLSDEQAEYRVRDGLSFTRFLARGIEDRVPDGTTLWLFRERFAKAGSIEKLFEQFGRRVRRVCCPVGQQLGIRKVDNGEYPSQIFPS
jgi:Transposase domain (DUF772)